MPPEKALPRRVSSPSGMRLRSARRRPACSRACRIAGLVVESVGVAESDRLTDREHVAREVLEHGGDLGPHQGRVAVRRDRHRPSESCPVVGGSRSHSSLANVVFPDPLAPTIAMICPRRSSKLTPASASSVRAGIPVADLIDREHRRRRRWDPGRPPFADRRGSVARNASKSRKKVTPSWTLLNAEPADCSLPLSCWRPTMATAASPIVIDPTAGEDQCERQRGDERRRGDERADGRQRQAPAHEDSQPRHARVPQLGVPTRAVSGRLRRSGSPWPRCGRSSGTRGTTGRVGAR